jgi:hypothetical protein
LKLPTPGTTILVSLVTVVIAEMIVVTIAATTIQITKVVVVVIVHLLEGARTWPWSSPYHTLGGCYMSDL